MSTLKQEKGHLFNLSSFFKRREGKLVPSGHLILKQIIILLLQHCFIIMAQRTIYKRRISPHLPLAKLLLTLRQVSFSPFEFSPAGSHPLRLTHASPATVCSLPSSGPQTQFFAIMMVTTIWCWHCTICFCGKHGLSSSWESFFFARAHGRGSEGWL